MTAEVAALEAKGLRKEYDGAVALASLDLKIESGQAVALLGHNGSGKTTFLRMVAGLLEPTDGTVSILGHPAGSLAARAALCYLPDTPVLYDDLSVMEHIEYLGRLNGATDWQERGPELLEVLGLASRADGLPSKFSRGLKQKAAIAAALIRPFDVLLVDEPFVGLDASGREALLKLLAEMHEDGATLIVATHQLDFIETVDRVIALRDGELVFDGDPDSAKVRELVEP